MFLAALLALITDPGWVEVDRAVAEVGDQVITASEVRVEAAIQLVRAGRVDAVRMSSLSAELERAALVSLVVRSLLLAEARRLNLRPASEALVDDAVARLASHFANQGDFVRFVERIGLSAPPQPEDSDDASPAFAPGWAAAVSPALRVFLRAELSAERFVELRVIPQRGSSKDPKASAKAALRAFVLRLADRTAIRFPPGRGVDLAKALDGEP